MTAYEMRISDWSSDVCSSDLADAADGSDAAGRQSRPGHGADGAGGPASRDGPGGPVAGRRARAPPCPARRALLCRSEEHTSELQSLMRISYAVFCLTKKK